MSQQRRLARTRSAHDHADLARMDDEIDAVQHAAAAIPGFELVDFDQWRARLVDGSAHAHLSVAPTQAGTQRLCVRDGKALGPCFRGYDEVRWRADSLIDSGRTKTPCPRR